MTKVGVLAAQGAFIEHINVLKALGIDAIEVRLPCQLKGLAGLIIPGGESTTIGKIMMRFDLLEPVRRLAIAGLPVYGTCAGMILLAKDIGPYDQPHLGILDVRVRRNAFGSQVDSFETDLRIPVLGERPFRGIFIRAPLVESVSPAVEVLATLPEGGIVAVRQRNLLATAFHPELNDDPRFHQYFLEMIEESNDSTDTTNRLSRAGVLQ
jgi:5'-phosphate synthase pdxT subunit